VGNCPVLPGHLRVPIHYELWPFKTENITVPVKRLSLMQSQYIPAAEKKNTIMYTELFGYDFGNAE
jgi:hypothetical protein